jgi:hypothetical protein
MIDGCGHRMKHVHGPVDRLQADLAQPSVPFEYFPVSESIENMAGFPFSNSVSAALGSFGESFRASGRAESASLYSIGWNKFGRALVTASNPGMRVMNFLVS